MLPLRPPCIHSILYIPRAPSHPSSRLLGSIAHTRSRLFHILHEPIERFRPVCMSHKEPQKGHDHEYLPSAPSARDAFCAQLGLPTSSDSQDLAQKALCVGQAHPYEHGEGEQENSQDGQVDRAVEHVESARLGVRLGRTLTLGIDRTAVLAIGAKDDVCAGKEGDGAG
jgi:hypothetical protein